MNQKLSSTLQGLGWADANLARGESPENDTSLDDTKRLQCMEIWGGNGAMDTSLATAGLDVWARIRPYDQEPNGGDVVYLSACSSGRVTRALLADVMGHGAVAAEAADSLRALMRRTINILNQGKLVAELNREFERLSELGRFASALAVSYYRPKKRLSVCNAGHPVPVIYRAATGTWSLLDPSSRERSADHPIPKNLPLGLFSDVDYDVFDVRFGPEDVLLLYTDGLVEAADEAGRELGVEGLLDVLNSAALDDPADVLPRVLRVVDIWSGGPLDDDVSMLLLRRNSVSSTLREDAGAPLRYLKHRLSR